MRILRTLCIPFSQQSAGAEPLALPDLTRLKPLPCPIPWPYQPLHMGPPSLPYPLALPALPCQAPLPCPILWPYQPSHVRPSSSALYSGPTTLNRSGIQTSTQSLGPTTPHRLGLHFPWPRPLPWPYQPSQMPLHCLMIYAITLVFSFPAPFSYLPLSPCPPKGPSCHP